MRPQSVQRLEKKGLRLDDEVRFIRSWLQKPLDVGAVTPSSRMLARAMASYVDCSQEGPVVELGPGTGPVTEALVAHGVAPERLVLVEFNPKFCQLLQSRFPAAKVVQGDAYGLRKTLTGVLHEPAAAIVSGLPMLTKPTRVRLNLLRDAFALLAPGAPYIQFTYAMFPPIPKPVNAKVEASEPIWLNFPPARVFVYRKG